MGQKRKLGNGVLQSLYLSDPISCLYNTSLGKYSWNKQWFKEPESWVNSLYYLKVC